MLFILIVYACMYMYFNVWHHTVISQIEIIKLSDSDSDSDSVQLTTPTPLRLTFLSFTFSYILFVDFLVLNIFEILEKCHLQVKYCTLTFCCRTHYLNSSVG